MTKMLKSALTLLGLSLLAAAPPPPASRPLSGNWFGDGFALRTAPTGPIVQGKCASGKITSPIHLDPQGKFLATGYFNPYTSGIRLADIAPRDQLATFTGRVVGNKLHLTIKIKGQPDLKPVMLRGAPAKFAPCR